jgi:hypothetical protein
MNAYVFDLPGVRAEQYDELCRKLNHGRPFSALADWPVPGILTHIAGPTNDGWRQLDVWESDDALARFRQHLMPLLADAGIAPVPPHVFPVHNIVLR